MKIHTYIDKSKIALSGPMKNFSDIVYFAIPSESDK